MTTDTKSWIRRFRFLHRMPVMPEDPPPCPHCGRCVFCGPPCCDGAAADLKAYIQSPEYQALVKKQREEGLARKRETKLAKRARRAAKLAAKTVAAWDTYDQFLADQSSWEGFVDTRES